VAGTPYALWTPAGRSFVVQQVAQSPISRPKALTGEENVKVRPASLKPGICGLPRLVIPACGPMFQSGLRIAPVPDP